jgi:hypothetical protein
MTDDDESGWWQQQQALEALEWWETESKRRSESEHRNPNHRRERNGEVDQSAQFGPGEDPFDSGGQKAIAIQVWQLEAGR